MKKGKNLRGFKKEGGTTGRIRTDTPEGRRF